MKLKGIIILLCLLLIVGSFFYFYEIKGSKVREEKKESEKKLYNFKIDAINKINLKRTDTEILLEKKKDKWEILKPITTSGDADNIQNLIDKISSLKYEREIEIKSNKLSEYGLNPPKINIQLLSGKKKIADLSVGDKNPTQAFVYYKDNLSNKAYLISASDGDDLIVDLYKIREKRISDFKSEEVKAIEIKKEENEMKLEFQNDFWYITKPKKLLADNSKISSFLASIEYLKAEKFEEENCSDPAKYGLDKPKYILNVLIGDKGKKQTLLVGNESDNQYYAMIEGKPQVVKISSTLVDDLKKDWQEWREKKPITFYSFEIQRFILKNKYGTFELAKDKDDNWKVIKPSSMNADNTKVENFFTAINRIESDEIIENTENINQYGFDKSNISLTIYTKENDKLIEKSIIVGKQDKEKKKVYVLNKESNSVFLMPEELIIILSNQLKNFLPDKTK